MLSDAEIGRNFPAALAVILPAQNQHGQAIEGERPDNAEGVCLAEGDDVAPGHDDREHLQAEDQVDDAMAGAESGVGLAEPVGENTVLGHAHQHAGRADHGGIDGAGKDQESDDHHEDAEGDAPKHGADHVHGQSGDQVVLIDVGALPCGYQHGGQQRGAAGKDQAVDGDYDGRALEVLQLGMLDFPVDLGKALLAAHGQDRMAERHDNAEQSEDR